MGSQVPNPEGIREIRDGAGDEYPAIEEGKRTVSALQEFLMHADTDYVLAFTQRMKLRLSITTVDVEASLYRTEFFRDGMLRYAGTGKGFKASLTNALAKFFIGEQRDHHEFTERGLL